MSFPINLVGELLAVRPDKPQGPVLLPDWKRCLSGSVIATGPDVGEVAVGDLVSFGAAVGMDSIFSGQEIRILKERDLDFIYLNDDPLPCRCEPGNPCFWHMQNEA